MCPGSHGPPALVTSMVAMERLVSPHVERVRAHPPGEIFGVSTGAPVSHVLPYNQTKEVRNFVQFHDDPFSFDEELFLDFLQLDPKLVGEIVRLGLKFCRVRNCWLVRRPSVEEDVAPVLVKLLKWSLFALSRWLLVYEGGGGRRLHIFRADVVTFHMQTAPHVDVVGVSCNIESADARVRFCGPIPFWEVINGRV